MDTFGTYILRIGAYSPTTIPMARLAEYMKQVAELLGEESSVHFAKLIKGSTNLVARVESPAQPRVADNVQRAYERNGNAAGSKAIDQIDQLLREDRTTGKLERDGANIIQFPGIKRVRLPRLGPFTQQFERTGVLVRIGGKDDSAHATLEDGSGKTWSFKLNKTLARQIASHLYGDPIVLHGEGRFVRNEEGEWETRELRAVTYSAAGTTSLREAVDRIRSIGVSWSAEHLVEDDGEEDDRWS